MVPINLMFIVKTQNYLHHGPPKRYKQNTINGNLHHSKRISSNFDTEIPLLKENVNKSDCTLSFINSVVNDFQTGKECGDESFRIVPSLFEMAKPFIFIEIPYCKTKKFSEEKRKCTFSSFQFFVLFLIALDN